MCKSGTTPVAIQEGVMPSESTRWYIAASIVALGVLIQFRRRAVEVLPIFCLSLPFIVLFLRRPRKIEKEAEAYKSLNIQNNPYSEVGINDHVRWSFIPSTGELRANSRKADVQETDDAEFRFLVLHAPTDPQDKDLKKSGKWRYGWHFKKRKRKWEVRVQVIFKKPPKGAIQFGVEMSPAPASSSKRAKAIIIGAIRTAIKEGFYQTAGDDPSCPPLTEREEEALRNDLSRYSLESLQQRAEKEFATKDELQRAHAEQDPKSALIELIVSKKKELEPGSFIMPMWVLDQFIVSEPGDEPDLAGDFEGLGTRRTSVGVPEYTRQMNETVENLQPDKVYTFLFWGISQFIDVSAWRFTGFGFNVDALNLSGPPPIYVVSYDMEGDSTRRHISSRKRYYFKVALWSDLKPPSPEKKREILRIGDEADADEQNHQTTANRRAKRTGLNRMLDSFQSCKVNLGCMGKSGSPSRC